MLHSMDAIFKVQKWVIINKYIYFIYSTIINRKEREEIFVS